MSLPTYPELTKSFGDQVVDAVKQAEERTVSAITSATEIVSALLPSVPSVPVPEGVPSPSAVVSANAALLERVLEAQTRFTLSVLESLPSYGEAEPATRKVSSAKAA
jgi:hypothetical protein